MSGCFANRWGFLPNIARRLSARLFLVLCLAGLVGCGHDRLCVRTENAGASSVQVARARTLARVYHPQMPTKTHVSSARTVMFPNSRWNAVGAVRYGTAQHLGDLLLHLSGALGDELPENGREICLNVWNEDGEEVAEVGVNLATLRLDEPVTATPLQFPFVGAFREKCNSAEVTWDGRSRQISVVYVAGLEHCAGLYEHRKGESVRSLVERACGEPIGDMTDYRIAHITNWTEPKVVTWGFRCVASLCMCSDFEVQPFDLVVVSEVHDDRCRVWVAGEVIHPVTVACGRSIDVAALATTGWPAVDSRFYFFEWEYTTMDLSVHLRYVRSDLKVVPDKPGVLFVPPRGVGY
jgi:hypothetical protein